MRLPWVAAVLLASTLTAPAIASAQGGSTVDANAERARELFVEGRMQFDLGRFEQAIRDFESAYRMKPDPVFLFNIAQAHRLAGNPERALFFYRSYLRNRPDAPNRADAEARIAQCQQQLDDRNRREERASRPSPAPAPVETTPTAPPTIVQAPARPAEQAANDASRTNWEGELSAGFGSWAGGGPEGASPGFVGSFAFGVMPAWARGDRVALRLAARASVWSAAEPDRRTTIVPLLLEPSLQIALGSSPVTLAVACGVGVAVFPALDARSRLLTEGAARVTGALSAIEVRPALTFRWALSAATAVALTAAYAWDGGLDPYFRERSLQRVEASLGVVQRW